MNRQDLANQTCARLIDFAYEIEELDKVIQLHPEISPRSEIALVLHDAVLRVAEYLTEIEAKLG